MSCSIRYDVRTPAGSGDFDYTVNAVDNWWGTTKQTRVSGRFKPEVEYFRAARKEIQWRPVAGEPQTEWVPAGEVPDPDPPDYTMHVDPAFLLGITEPRHGECLTNEGFEEMEGYASGALSSPPDKIEVALRRQDRHGCTWWSDHRRRLVRDSCGFGRWISIRRPPGASEHSWDWLYRFKKTLPPGKYASFIRWRGKTRKVHGCFDPGAYCVKFRLL